MKNAPCEPRCEREKRCFARDAGTCTILTEKPDRDPCPFAKLARYHTGGKYYPYDYYDVRYKNKKEYKDHE